jgi:hypothetical protein
MRQQARIVILIICAVLARSQGASPAEFVLVREGEPCGPIVLAPGTSPMTREAAQELASYLQKISGASFTILEGPPDPLPPHALWVGFQPVLRNLFPDVSFEFTHPEEILIVCNGNHLAIVGRDRWDPDRSVAQGPDEVIVGKQWEYGTVNAVYTFLQDYLGVRWLWPGELGEDIIPQQTITFAPFQYRYWPQFRARAGAFHFSSLGNKGYGRSHRWTRLQRLQLDSLHFPGGHVFTDWWDRFHESHPEYFALQPDGTRSGFPGGKYAKLCQSNPAVWQQWLEDVKAKLHRDPTQTVFSGAFNDSWASGFCVCPQCEAWDHPEGELRLFHWKGVQKLHVALSDREVTFANHLARLLKEAFPQEEYYVLTIAYGHTRPVPVAARPADNVIVASVANFFGRRNLVDRGSTRGTTHRQQFEDWSRVAGKIMWRPNTGSPAGWQQGLPDLFCQELIEDLQFVARCGCMGIFVDSVWEHWATQGPLYYLLAQLVWDPGKNGQAVLEDYYRRGFGPAAPYVRAYFETFESARKQFVETYGYESPVLNFVRLYTDDLLRRAEECLRQAESAVADGPALYAQRVSFIRAGFRYTELMAEIIRLMGTYWRSKDPGIAERVRGNWAEIQRLCQANPYAVNWGPIRPTTPRMLGLHPDYPNPKWKSFPATDAD